MTWAPPAIPRRRRGWERAFVAELDRHLAAPFRWGVSDCLTIAADICEAMTGVDPFPDGLRGSYTGVLGAQRELARFGFEGVLEALQIAFPTIPKARARRGDCGTLVSTLAGVPQTSTMIVLGNGMAVGKQEGKGLAFVPVLQLGQTFAIGFPDWLAER